MENEGFVSLGDYDLNPPTGSDIRLGKNASKLDHRVIVRADYDTKGYKITVIVEPGIVNAYEDGTNISLNSDSNVDNNSIIGGNNSTNPDGIEHRATEFIDIFNSDNYHLSFSESTSDAATSVTSSVFDGTVDLWIKDGKIAVKATLSEEVMTLRLVQKNGKQYAISDDYKVVTISPLAPDDEMNFSFDDYHFLGTGSDSFYGDIYEYEEYSNGAGSDEDTSVRFYFSESGLLMGFRNMHADKSFTDVVLFALDSNIPADIFTVPGVDNNEDYQIIEQ
jgi:hypothetical protein